MLDPQLTIKRDLQLKLKLQQHRKLIIDKN